MVSLPPVTFEVTLVVPAEMRWALRAKGAIEDWLLSDTAAARPVGELPAADLRIELDRCELTLSWLELEAASAWEAVACAAGIVEGVLPELLRGRALRVEALRRGAPDAPPRGA